MQSTTVIIEVNIVISNFDTATGVLYVVSPDAVAGVVDRAETPAVCCDLLVSACGPPVVPCVVAGV